MKLYEILTSDYQHLPLFELAMNRRTYEQVLNQYADEIHVGFEFEMAFDERSQFLPDPADVEIDPADVPDEYKMMVKDMDVDDANNYFHLRSGRQAVDTAIEELFSQWLEEEKEQYVEDKWEEFVDDDIEDEAEAEEDAKESAEKDFEESEPDIDDFIEDQDMESILDQIGADPDHGWTDNDRDQVFTVDPDELRMEMMQDADSMLDHAKESIEEALPRSIRNSVDIKGDSSIDANGGVGIEIASEPMGIHEALEFLDDVLMWMHQHGAKTNDSTGLHINVSVDNIENLDPLKLAVFLGDEYVAELFDRLNNNYAPSQIKSLIRKQQQQGNVLISGEKELVDSMIQVLSDMLDKQKYSSINLDKLRAGYVEFRSPGGDYLNKGKQIEQTLKRIATVMVIATNPDAYRNEYLKKITKLLNRGEEEATKPYQGLTSGLISLHKSVSSSSIANDYKMYDQQPSMVHAYEFLISVLQAAQQSPRFGSKLGAADVKLLRNAYRRYQKFIDPEINKNLSEQDKKDFYTLLRLKSPQTTQ